MSEGILTGRRVLVTGVLTQESIAFGIARQVQREGGEVILTGHGRAARLTRRAAKRLKPEPEVLELDVTREEDFGRLREALAERWPALDGIVHSIAYAPEDALGGNFLHTPRASAETAFVVSAYSLKALVVELLPLLRESEGDASVVSIDFDASVAWPVHDWMGVSKAALEAIARYLTRDVGPLGVRVNLISPGPLRTMAASNIPNGMRLGALWATDAPLGWDVDDQAIVAKPAAFLLSGYSRGISGEIVHVDGGAHAVRSPAADGGAGQAGAPSTTRP